MHYKNTGNKPGRGQESLTTVYVWKCLFFVKTSNLRGFSREIRILTTNAELQQTNLNKRLILNEIIILENNFELQQHNLN